MSIISFLKSWWTGAVTEPKQTRRSQPPVRFNSIVVLPKILPDEEVKPDQFYVVAHNKEMYWALFRCPEGCGEVIALPLRAPHSPRWSVNSSPFKRPTLKPSVWRNKGCKSHFILEDGRIHWCGDTGISPSAARPDLYKVR